MARAATRFERPYGLAWLLQLAAELKEFDDPQARQWSATLRPLEQTVTARIAEWLPKLQHPIRVGEHNNTAFSMGLMLDYARVTGNTEFGKIVESRVRDYYLKDRNCPLAYEPSGEDFLSPCLAEADVVRRILPPAEFARWLADFLPRVDLEPTLVSDVTDGKAYHLAGLNLSRAWMLEGIVSKLPAADRAANPSPRSPPNSEPTGLDSIKGEHYEGGHWLGSFAVYLVSGRGSVAALSAYFFFARALAGENSQVEGIRHRLVPGVVGVQVIARVELRAQPFRIGRIARRGLEIHHRVECAAGPNPRIHRGAGRLAIFPIVAGPFIRRQRAADHLDPMGVRLRDQLLVCADQFVGGNRLRRHRGLAPDVVDAFHQRHPFDSRLAEHVAIEARQRAGAAAVAQHAIAADPHVGHADLRRILIGRQARRQQGRPTVIGLRRGACAVGNGIAEGDQRRRVRRLPPRPRRRASNTTG